MTSLHSHHRLSLLCASLVPFILAAVACSKDSPVEDDPQGSTTSEPESPGSGGRHAGDPGAAGGAGGAGGETSDYVQPGTPVEVCEPGLVNPAVDLDSIHFYAGASGHLCTLPEFALEDEWGTACASAEDEAACLEEVERLASHSSDWGQYENFWEASWGLLVVTGAVDRIEALGGPVEDLESDTCGSFTRGGERWGSVFDDDDSSDDGAGGAGGANGTSKTLSDAVTKIADRDTLLKFLGTIDTPTEALMVMWAHGYRASCALTQDDDDYVASTNEMTSDCPVTHQRFEVRVTPDGVLSSIPIGEPSITEICY